MAGQEHGVVLLDGGMGQELTRRSSLPLTPLWSARQLLEEPELVEQVHVEFIEAGARVITLNSYPVTPPRLARDGAGEQFEALQRAAVDIARRARQRAAVSWPVRIAGCLPPLVTSYRADLVPTFERCLADYRRIVEAQAAGVDLFLCETMTRSHEAAAAVRAGAQTGKPVWAALTVDDTDGGKARSGEPVERLAEAALTEGAEAILVNCSTPEATSRALEVLKHCGATRGIPLGGYANGFTSVEALEPGGMVDVLEARADLGPAEYARTALTWAQAGVRILGGCCEISPVHIAELHRSLLEAGYAIEARL